MALAKKCCEKFVEPVTTLGDVEKRGNDALELLIER
jgi:hypothetical protein